MRSLFLSTIFALWPIAAQAYVGPGAGMGAIAVTIASLLGLVFLVVGFLWYPLKRVLRSRKASTGADQKNIGN